MNLPRQCHAHCQHTKCEICLDDLTRLADYIFEHTGLQRQFHDILGEYRLWLDREKIPAESPDGWALPGVFQAKNVERFILHVKGEMEP